MIDTIILKVASRCNLSCTYCYEYASGDQSWRSKPRVLSVESAGRLGERIREYTQGGSPEYLNVVLHGGEPLLAGHDHFEALVSMLVSHAGPDRIRLHLQSNGMLLDETWCMLLERFDIKVGISLDGDATANAARVDHRGRPSWERTVAGIALLKSKAPTLFGGILCVVDPRNDPRSVLTTLFDFSPPTLDLLQPFITHDMHDEASGAIVARFGQWMIDATDFWLSNPQWHGTRVRFIEDAMKAVAGVKPKSDWFGQRGVTYLIVESDGRYDLQDQLKVIGSASVGVREVRGSVFDTRIDDAYVDARLRADRLEVDRLPTECAHCRWRVGCGGGFVPTRYSSVRGFDNPTTYCSGLQSYFTYLDGVLKASVERNAPAA
jgi:uncharacterized protein